LTTPPLEKQEHAGAAEMDSGAPNDTKGESSLDHGDVNIEQRDKILLETNGGRAALINYLAGVGGGIAVVLSGHPFDTTKTRMQVAPPGFYKNTLDAVKQTIKFEGIKGFYAGMMSPMLGQMFFRAVSFMTFYSSLRIITKMSSSSDSEDADDVPSVRSTFLAGALTGLLISAVEAPIDVVKTKLQIQVSIREIFVGCCSVQDLVRRRVTNPPHIHIRPFPLPLPLPRPSPSLISRSSARD